MPTKNFKPQKREMSFSKELCYAVGAAAVFAAAMFSPPLMAQEQDGDLGPLLDELGQINAWRHIPSVLLERCAGITPQSRNAMQHSMNLWSESNRDLVALIDSATESSMPLLARAMSSSVEDARKTVQEGTKSLIIKNYFGDSRFTALEICSDYKDIVEKLSGPGTVASTRGTVYAVEGYLLSRIKK